jgi:ribosome-binding factor A
LAWDRKERLEALIKEKVAIIVLERLNDPRLGFVTITGVQLSKDKRHAKVLYTVLGSTGQRRTTERALQDAARHVQEQIAPTLRMRTMPEIRFVYDESIEKESRMLDLLDDIATKRRESGAGSASLADAEDEEAGAGAGRQEEPGNGANAALRAPSSSGGAQGADEAGEADTNEHDAAPGEGDSQDEDRASRRSP